MIKSGFLYDSFDVHSRKIDAVYIQVLWLVIWIGKDTGVFYKKRFSDNVIIPISFLWSKK
jgi:hypothetical protein